MRVAGHCIPDTAGSQLGKAHGKLACLQHIGMDELVDHSLVGVLLIAAGTVVCLVKREECRLARLVCGI